MCSACIVLTLPVLCISFNHKGNNTIRDFVTTLFVHQIFLCFDDVLLIFYITSTVQATLNIQSGYIKSSSYKDSSTLKAEQKVTLIRYQLFVYTTNSRRLVESCCLSRLAVGRQTDGPGRPITRVFLSLNSSHLLCSSGRPAAVDTDASPKRCHSGSGPPNRYKITT